VTPSLRCDDVADSIEALAAGEPDLCAPGVVEHVRTCDACGHRVATARRLDALLAVSFAAARVPEGFTARVVKRAHAERRRRERIVVRVFNVAILGAGVVLLAAGALLLQWTGVSVLLASVASLAGEGVMSAATATRDDTFLYIAGSLAALTALVMWRWSEGERFL
jgi:anti-sigma factor RsiW